MAKQTTNWAGWRERFRALPNVLPLMRIVWESGRVVVLGNGCARLLSALVPICMLAVSKQILDAIQKSFGGSALREDFWLLVGAEFGLAAAGAVLGRTVGFFDALLADRFTRHVSLRVMEHA